MVADDDLVERELMISRLRRLIAELLRGVVRRTTFQAWEVELLLDIDETPLDPKRRDQTLRSYERAVIRQLESGAALPMKLSEYLQRSKTRRPANE